MDIIVCEDSKKDMDLLCSHINRFFKDAGCRVEIIAYESGDFLLDDWSNLRERDIRITFMDIYMPGSFGIDVARKIRDAGNDKAIIFTTTSLEHGLDGYSVDALQYLVKPLDYSQVKSALDKCKRLYADSLRYVEVMSNRLMIRVLLKDILYIEIYNHTCFIHTMSETIKNYLSLEEVWQLLDAQEEHTFLRIHRSYIVNMRYIEDMTDDDFLLAKGAVVPIRRKDKLAIKQAYMDYLFMHTRRGQ